MSGTKITLNLSTRVVSPDGNVAIVPSGTITVSNDLMMNSGLIQNLFGDCGDVDPNTPIDVPTGVRPGFFDFAEEYYREVPSKDGETDVEKEKLWIDKHKASIMSRLPGYHEGLKPFVAVRWEIRKEWLDIARKNISEIREWWAEIIKTRIEQTTTMYDEKLSRIPSDNTFDINRTNDDKEDELEKIAADSISVDVAVREWIRWRSNLSESNLSPAEVQLQKRERYNEYLRKCEEYEHRPEDDWMCDCANPLDFSRLLHSFAKLHAAAVDGMTDEEFRKYCGEEGISNNLTDEELVGFESLFPVPVNNDNEDA